MKIVVLVKEVPDTYGDRKLDLETGLADRAASERVLDEIGERALEVALSYADANPGTEVQVEFEYKLPGGLGGRALGAILEPFVGQAIKQTDGNLRSQLA